MCFYFLEEIKTRFIFHYIIYCIFCRVNTQPWIIRIFTSSLSTFFRLEGISVMFVLYPILSNFVRFTFELFQSCLSIVGRAAKHEDLRAAHSYLLCEFSSVHKKKNMFVVSLWSSFSIDIRFRLKRNLRAIAGVQIWLDYISILAGSLKSIFF